MFVVNQLLAKKVESIGKRNEKNDTIFCQRAKNLNQQTIGV